MKKIYLVNILTIIAILISCTDNKDSQAAHQLTTKKETYICPMPEDSVFSDKPGKCPKCGMQLMLMEADSHQHNPEAYTCPMPEDSIFSDKPGKCPKCGMDLVKNEMNTENLEEIALGSLLKPTNELVISSIPVTTIEKRGEQIEIEALGNIMYDTRQVGNISARVSGRIEKLYVRYRYQKISKGQKIADIYSPELLTAQQNLLFLLKNDPDNTGFIEAAKEKLLLLGMENTQLQTIIQTGKPILTITVYSNYSGHIHEANNGAQMNPRVDGMKDIALLTEELSLKEGMYLQKGQSMLTVYNPNKAWALLNIYGDNQSLIQIGNKVRIVPETAPQKDFRATIDFIEPFYQKNSKTLTVRVYFDNSNLNIPIGSQVKAAIFGNSKKAFWLPKEAVLSLGIDKVVFQKTDDGFKATKITTGITHEKHIQIIQGITEKDSVAMNAQYLMDSESFIKIKQ